jgi:hypothetical protein
MLALNYTNVAQGGLIRSCAGTGSSCNLHRQSRLLPLFNEQMSGTGSHPDNFDFHRLGRNDHIRSFKYKLVGNMHHYSPRSYATSTTHRYMTAEVDTFPILTSDATSTQVSNMIMTDNDSIGMLSKEATTIVFIIGVIPFVIATYEFWRRIAVGATFGTGNDSVVFPTLTTIGEDNDPTSSRGKQILGADSLITAYIIFATVAVVLGIVLYAVVTSPIPPST